MTQEAFIKELDKGKYPYEIQGDKVIVTYKESVDLNRLESLPPGVEFKNGGYIWAESLQTIPPGVEFKNGGGVKINGLNWVDKNKEIKIEGVGNKRLLNLMIRKGLFV